MNDSIQEKNREIDDLRKKITDFQQKYNQSHRKSAFSQKHQNLALVLNVFADLLAGIITAFILNRIYTYFFGKNTLVFALLLIFCTSAGLYNTIKYFYKTNSANNQNT